MLTIGIFRRIDQLGRVTIPKEIREIYKLACDEQIEIIGTEDGILLRIPGIEIKRITKAYDKTGGTDDGRKQNSMETQDIA